MKATTKRIMSIAMSALVMCSNVSNTITAMAAETEMVSETENQTEADVPMETEENTVIHEHHEKEEQEEETNKIPEKYELTLPYIEECTYVYDKAKEKIPEAATDTNGKEDIVLLYEADERVELGLQLSHPVMVDELHLWNSKNQDIPYNWLRENTVEFLMPEEDIWLNVSFVTPPQETEVLPTEAIDEEQVRPSQQQEDVQPENAETEDGNTNDGYGNYSGTENQTEMTELELPAVELEEDGLPLQGSIEQVPEIVIPYDTWDFDPYNDLRNIGYDTDQFSIDYISDDIIYDVPGLYSSIYRVSAKDGSKFWFVLRPVRVAEEEELEEEITEAITEKQTEIEETVESEAEDPAESAESETAKIMKELSETASEEAENVFEIVMELSAMKASDYDAIFKDALVVDKLGDYNSWNDYNGNGVKDDDEAETTTIYCSIKSSTVEEIREFLLSKGVKLKSKLTSTFTLTCQEEEVYGWHSKSDMTASRVGVKLTYKNGVVSGATIDLEADAKGSIRRQTMGHYGTSLTIEQALTYIEIQKTDSETGKAVSAFQGAQYTIYTDAACTKAVETLTLNASGYAKSSDMAAAVYYVKETKEPTGYEVDKTTHKVDASKSAGSFVTLSVEDKPTRKPIEIQKYDKETGKAQPNNSAVSFENAEYTIYTNAACTSVKEIVKTNKSGYGKSSDLPLGTYYVKETKAPTGYELDPTVYTVTVGTDDKVSYRINSQEQVIRGSLSLMKYLDDRMDESVLQDLYREGTLKGITFTLRHEDSNIKKPEIVTDRYGYAATEPNALVYGTWYITETKTPEGYKGIKDVAIKITENGAELKYVLTNARVKLMVELVKKDLETGNVVPIKGAKFQILDSTGTPITMRDNLNYANTTDIFETNDDGIIVLTQPLNYGTYTVKEVEAPKGYLIAEPKTVVLDENNAFEEVKFEIECYDSPQLGKIKIIKKDPSGNTLGEGFQFEIRTAEDITDASGEIRKMEIDGKQVELKAGTIVEDEITTDENGMAESRELYLGKYIVKETTSGEYYAINNADYEVTLNPDASVEVVEVEVEVTDEKTSMDLFKVDSENEETPLEGVKFRIFSSTDASSPEELQEAARKFRSGENKTAIDTYGEEYTTDENGQIHVEELQHNTTYYIYETATLPGYNLDTGIYDFTVDNDGLIDGASSYTLKISNVPNLVEISKKDITGKEELPGATLTLTREDGSLVETWVSEEQPHYIRGLEAGTYILTEEQAPEGYAIAESIVFSLTDSFEVQQVTMYDDRLQVSVSKRIITGEEELPGASLTITAQEGEVVAAWISSDEPYIVNLPVGKYTLTEVAAPDKYATAESIEFEVLEDRSVTSVVMYDSPILVEISKKDITNGDELPGAKLQILDADGEVVEEWISGEEPHTVSLSVGTYTLHEDAAPAGYAVASSIVFEVTDTAEIQKVEMYDKLIEVEISKKDITNGEELPGAKLTVIKIDGDNETEIETWVSTDQPHKMNLEAGTYRLTETAAPEKYAKAESIEFTVTDSMEVQKVTMYDKLIEVEISKKDITNDKELPGAKLIIKDKDGKTVEEWISKEEPHNVNLPAGSYTLTEVTAPDGYEVAETIMFTVTDSMEVQHVTMYDSPKDGKVNLTGKEDTKTVGSGGNSTYSGSGSVSSAPVKTGDYNRYLPAIITIAAGLAGLSVVLLRRSKKKRV